MKPRTAERVAFFLVPLAVVLAVIAAVRSDWIAVAAMALLILGQALNLWGIRRRREKSDVAPRDLAGRQNL
jgi:hypothetical protein